MKGALVLLSILLGTGLPSRAQSDTISSTPPALRSFVAFHGGLLFGASANVEETMQLMAGVRLNKLGLGVGVGYENQARWQAVPLVAGVSYDVLAGRSSVLYAQLDAGFARTWSREGAESLYSYDHDGGFHFHPMVGYRVHAGKVTLYLKTGYRIQYLRFQQDFRHWHWGWTSPQVFVDQRLERLTFSIGFGLG